MARVRIEKKELLFDNRYLVTLIIPLLIETLLNVTIGMMDTIMVASDGEAVVSGVSLVDSLANLFVFVFSAFATGGAVVCSQYLGRKDNQNASESAKQLIYLSLGFAIVIMVFLLIFRESIVRFVFGSIEEDVPQFCCEFENNMKYTLPELIALLASFISTINVESPLTKSSLAPILVNILSKTEIVQLLAGTNDPICAIIIIIAKVLI